MELLEKTISTAALAGAVPIISANTFEIYYMPIKPGYHVLHYFVQRFLAAAFLLISTTTLTACGGGGGSSESAIDQEACGTLGLQPKIISGSACQSGSPVAKILLRGQFICSATVIAPTKLLTAAHCFTGGLLPIRLNTNSANYQIEFPEVAGGVYSVKQITLSPRWISDLTRIGEEFDLREGQKVPAREVLDAIFSQGLVDLAVIEISKPAPVSSLPLLASRYPGKGEVVGIYGYGFTTPGGEPSTALVSGEMEIDRVGDYNLGSYFRDEGSNTCSGDSGGPMVAQLERALVGVTSLGTNNCEPGEFSIFSGVQGIDALNFITQIAPEAVIR